ncbi:glycosyltransferase [Enterococcus mundtii]|nr:glycosyltransferase [Enterococcus mundtii]NBA62429.1 glycosyltransferase [Enterococcus mundtii]SFM17600.1 Glycosyltransferase involved in cell wall bisynthesis [Enterococcus mundtii]
MVRVLNVIGRRPTGGIGAVVKNYQSHFNEKIIFDYLLFSNEKDGEFDAFVKKLGSNVYVLPALEMKNLFVLKTAVKKFFEQYSNNYDIAHIHTVNIAFLVAKYAKRSGIKNIIAHSHATKFSDKKINSIRNRLLCVNLKKLCTDFIACSSEAGYFLFGKRFMEMHKVNILKNAIDIKKFEFSLEKRKKIRSEFKLKDEVVFASIGRLSKQKNQKFLIDIFNEIHKELPNSKLLIVGEGQELENLKAKSEKLGLNNEVIFTGSRNDIDFILSGIDIFLMPSLYEGLPVIGVEALSSGLPCIFSDEISKEFQSEKSYYISLNNSSLEWAKQIINIVNINIDRNLSQTEEMGYDINVEAPKLIEYYKGIINRSEDSEKNIVF